MTNKKSTRKSLIYSALSLVLCLSMMIGTTFAWFTDSVTSANNIIQSGNLDVELYYENSETSDWTKVNSSTNVFKKDTLWEPGHTEVIKLKVANEGSLALKYQLGVNIVSETGSINKDGELFKLSDYIYFGIVEGDNDYTRETAIAAVEEKAVKIKEGISLEESSLEAGTDSAEYVTMVVYMPETVGNEANYRKDAEVPTIELGINLVATQYTSESDSFGNDYDEDAEYPEVATVNVPEGITEPVKLVVGDVTVYVPVGAPAGTYELEVTGKHVETDENDETTVTYDINVTRNDEKTTGVPYQIEINVGTLLDIKKLDHNGVEITAGNYEYDILGGTLSFETDSFSPFSVEYEEIGMDTAVENRQIVAGVFPEINPADIDETLLDEDSKYIAINYEQDGKTYYVVNERETTVVVSASDTVYAAKNANYTVTNASGKLYSVISGLQGNEFSTVYILPGTYNEATTIYVYSSMDIIGLGDKEEIKVVKGSSSSSNRHLFNCNGTKEDYIQVTIRNMTLDATAKTTNNKDNAAVQSIRKTKVKCYDLIVIKGTGWDAVAFYVNGNNAVGGVKYPAYMYVENCTLNTTRTFGIVTTSGTYKFYHNGLTYNNGDSTYTNNSGSNKNIQMELTDWEWQN